MKILKKENEEFSKKLDDLNKEKSQKEETKKEKQDKLDEDKTKAENLSNENKNLQQTINEEKKNIENLNNEKTEKENSIKGKTAEKTELEKNLNSKKEELKKLEESLKTVSEEEKQKAKDQWDKGSVGFFEQNGSTKAVEVFTKLPNNDRAKEIGQEYLKANENMSPDDSRSLENMKKAIEALKVVNEKRQEDGGIDGRKLSVLKISDFDMAVAQANANYSANKIEHAGIHQPPFENLHWGGSDKGKEAIEGWWDQEKILFDYLRKKGCKSREEMGSI